MLRASFCLWSLFSHVPKDSLFLVFFSGQVDFKALVGALDAVNILTVYNIILSEQQLLFISENPFVLSQVCVNTKCV